MNFFAFRQLHAFFLFSWLSGGVPVEHEGLAGAAALAGELEESPVVHDAPRPWRYQTPADPARRRPSVPLHMAPHTGQFGEFTRQSSQPNSNAPRPRRRNASRPVPDTHSVRAPSSHRRNSNPRHAYGIKATQMKRDTLFIL